MFKGIKKVEDLLFVKINPHYYTILNKKKIEILFIKRNLMTEI